MTTEHKQIIVRFRLSLKTSMQTQSACGKKYFPVFVVILNELFEELLEAEFNAHL